MKSELARPQPHASFLFTHGFAARMVLRTGLAKGLIKQGMRVTVISPNAHEPYFQKECEEEQVELVPEPKCGGRIANWFRAYRPYLLDDVLTNPAHNTRHLRRRRNYPLSCFVSGLINRTLAKHQWFRATSRFIERRLNRSGEVKRQLSGLRPDLLVLLNPFGVEETVYLLHAKELGIPVACQMLSWDNITSKGTPLLLPDYFLSWGPVMSQEMVELYGFPRNKIFECGVPHFDVYVRQDELLKKEEILERLGLPRSEPYIFYGMGPRYASPNELEIVSWLAEQVNAKKFQKPCSLIIRAHPQTISGDYALSSAELNRLHALTGPRVAIDMPPVLSERLAWDLPKTDMNRLASLLAGSAMCLNANSTLCLDACMLNTPVITVAFDGHKDLPYWDSARHGLDYFHLAKLFKFGGVRVARSFPELKRHIDMYFINPELDREARLLSATQECGIRDGCASQRAARVIARLARVREEKRR